MPEVEVTIGGRSFHVACLAGEEGFLLSAAQILDTEAASLVAQAGRIPETRMLLMAGLMIADRLAGIEEQLRVVTEDLAALSQRAVPEPLRIEVPVVAPEVVEAMAEIAARTEALAQQAEERLGARPQQASD